MASRAVCRWGPRKSCRPGDRAILIDDQSAGELVVHIVDVDGDFCGVVLVFLEKSQQLVGTGGHGPEGNGRAVDVDRSGRRTVR